MRFKTNHLFQLAKKYLESPDIIDEREIASKDITKEFLQEVCYNMLVNRESINMNINAIVRSGKSTVLFAIGQEIQNSMVKLGFTDRMFSIYNIARTQYELSKKMREPDLNNIFICVDEFDDLEETGENSTVERALLQHFSKIQAGRYIHRGYCSPNDIPDDGSNLIVNVIQADKQKKVTHCRVYYRLFKGGTTYTQCIGHININVGNVVKNWVEQGIEEKFYNQDKSEDARKQVEEWRKRDWYIEYMCRKFEKMDMINSLGIFRTKELDYADVILEIIEELQDLCKVGGLNQREIKNHVRSMCRKNKIPLSLVGEQIMTDRVDGVLSLLTRYNEKYNKIRKTTDPKQREILITGTNKLKEIAEKDVEELKYLARVKKKYYGEEEDATTTIQEN